MNAWLNNAFFFVISIIASLTFFLPQTLATLTFNNGVYTNLCGTGLVASTDTCNRGCNTASGSCTSSSPHVVKWTCDGKLTECRGDETSFSTSQTLSGTACGKTSQIDVFDAVCRVNGNWVCSDRDHLQDYMVWYSGDCPLPTSTPTPTITPTPIPIVVSSCDSLSIVSGNNSLVPANVTLRARGSDNRGNIQSYRFFFGDGKQEETTNPEIIHRYESSGTFVARVDIKDSQGVVKSSATCETTVTVQASPIESQKSDCSDLFITEGNFTRAPTTAKFVVTGFDNKGSIKRYKLDFGDGTSMESQSNTFSKRYNTAATYTVRGFILDSLNNWKGGSGSCEKSFYVATRPLASQPKTGTPTEISLLGLASGAFAYALYLYRKKLTASY